jgi:hypothetical protein
MAGNGDERMMAVWERVEAKLDRLGEVVARQGEILTRQSEVLAEHGRMLAQLDRRLSRVERDLDMVKRELDLVKLMIKGLRVDVDRKLLRLQDELLTALGRETRVELLAAQSLNDDRLEALERRVLALEAKG